MNYLVRTLLILFLVNLFLIGSRILLSVYDDILLDTSLNAQISAKGDPQIRGDFLELRDRLEEFNKPVHRLFRIPRAKKHPHWKERADRQRFLKAFEDGLVLWEMREFKAAEPALITAQGLLYTLEDLKILGAMSSALVPGSIKGVYGRIASYLKLFQSPQAADGRALLHKLRTLVFLLRVQCMVARHDFYNLRYYLEIILPSLRQVEAEGFLGQTISKLLYPKPFLALVRRFAKKHGTDEHLIYSVMREESHFKSDIISRAGAQGLMQVMPATAKVLLRRVKRGAEFSLGPESLFDPELNIELGAYYLTSLALRFSGQPEQFLAAYNAGARNVEKWKNRSSGKGGFLEAIRFPETKSYVMKVLRARFHYDQIYPESASEKSKG